MTDPVDELSTKQKYVLFFDFCSSTLIIEDLIRTESQERWRNLLIGIKKFLVEEREIHGFEIYKFIGDGWILLFDKDFSPSILFSLLKRLCDKYDKAFNKHIRGILSTDIDTIGITFGLDRGSLIKIVMDGRREYIGRPLNVAARLQGSIKDNDSSPQGKVLMSNIVYDYVKQDIRNEYLIYKVRRKLGNISGGERYQAKKLMLYEKPKRA